ncbi:fructose-6-phosphate aldolase [Candidatus Micrarchaeota archaeon CG08_land_8_20_14_0_20_49_17]|nr:MAG: fructose-6-phosphate aldolase [Candidatus Micrarchaeota archaeon CG1_02_49_24]PIU09625.1 MAG: fructose-6-phosphate aldolase [Candidatus Micrarchaeota archaeon CG08_land_8_20_14_0_20_49_17]HII54162.1 fructose-6-phosphate aldolase [Candidatus Micrarchaeota archaeon]
MKIFLDSANTQKIKEAAAMGLCDGITTNPTIILKEGRDHKEVIKEISALILGPISVEGIGETADEMVKDAVEFSKWGKNIVAKVPMTKEGLKAVRILEAKGIPTNVTLVFSPAQALLAAKAGASYISPFVGRLDDISQNGMALIAGILTILKNYGFKSQVIVASVRSPMHVVEAAKAGAHIATVPPDVFDKLFSHPLTDKGIKSFIGDYKKANSALGEVGAKK